jgi:hypothetical protein
MPQQWQMWPPEETYGADADNVGQLDRPRSKENERRQPDPPYLYNMGLGHLRVGTEPVNRFTIRL